MIVIMRTGASQQQIDGVVKAPQERGYGIHLSRGVEKTIIGAIGGDRVVVMAGPCSVESEEQVVTTARAVRAAGASILRGGARGGGGRR